jgi:hypothetical protein
VLIDGKGQAQKTTEAYGWIPRFLNGRSLAYCVGDASNAYPETGLTRFRRHMVLLRPRTVVVYDELAADHPAEWTWLLHADEEIRQPGEDGVLSLQTAGAKASAHVRASVGLAWSIDSQFVPPADNWYGKKKVGEVIEYPDQWHVRGVSTSKVGTARILAVIQLAEGDAEPAAVRDLGNGSLVVDGWSISAELEAQRPPALLIRSGDGTAALAVGHETVEIAGKTYRTATPGAALLVESVGGELTVKQACDELPAAAR